MGAPVVQRVVAWLAVAALLSLLAACGSGSLAQDAKNAASTATGAAQGKLAYLERYARPRSASGWHFLTGGKDSIARVAGAAGFRYAWDDELHQYAHPAGLVLLTPEGRISRYFFGVDFAPGEMRYALIEASGSRMGSLSDRVWLLCHRYDPRTGRYEGLVLGAMRAFGLAIALALATLIVVLCLAERRKRALRRR